MVESEMKKAAFTGRPFSETGFAGQEPMSLKHSSSYSSHFPRVKSFLGFLGGRTL
jgi:hypothetical protein